MRRVSLSWMLNYSAAKVGIGVHDMFFNAVVGLFLRDSYGLSNMAIGFLANERSFLGSVLQPVVGGVSDRTRSPLGRRRPFMLLGVPVTVACLLLLMVQPPVWLAVLLIILAPLFLGVAIIPYQALLPDNVVSEQRGSVSGVNVLLGMAGGIGLLVAATMLYERRPAVVFLLVAVTLAAGFLVTLVTVPDTPAPADAGPRDTVRPLDYLRGVWRQREAVKYVVCYFAFWFGIGGITPFITRFGKEELGVSEGNTFVLLLAVVIPTMLFAWPAGWLGDRYGKKRMTSLGLLAFAVLILAGSQVRSVPLIVVVLVLAGLAQAVTSVLSYPLFTELVPARRMGELTGLSTMVWSLAQPLGATTLGALADQTGTLRTVFVGAGIALLVALAILQTVHMPRVTASPDTEPAEDVSAALVHEL